ncbi:MAG: hypothetical protein ACR2FV_18385 [Ornithinimicrobium sp.]|uniref:hypothetical protein n=1 Tax=Ornithinimicrobium sp. TaxID=1977084 RepID=UPI003D9BF9C9
MEQTRGGDPGEDTVGEAVRGRVSVAGLGEVACWARAAVHGGPHRAGQPDLPVHAPSPAQDLGSMATVLHPDGTVTWTDPFGDTWITYPVDQLDLQAAC